MSSLPNIRRAIGSMRWAIVPEKLEAIIEVLELRIAKGSRLSAEEIEARQRSGMVAPPRRHAAARTSAAPSGGKVAVLPLTGLIMPKAAMVNGESLPAGTSCEQFAAMFDQAVNDPGISAIVIDVDSPGGSVTGVPELAARMLSARGAKPIVAVANGLAASAAYWLATAADELVVAPSGEVGSIGVFCVHAEGEDYFAKEGIRHTIIKAGEFKAEGNPYERLSEEAQAAIQSDIDTFYGMFVGAVARNRGVGVATVEKNFGRGRCVLAKMAVASGMADRVGTLESVLRRFGVTGTGYSPSRAAATSFRASEDVSTATAPVFEVGDRVRSLVDHMPGMTGMVGTVTTANAGSPPYYGVTFDGETEEHRWLAEDEVESADEEKKDGEMKMAASAVIGVAAFSGATATITAPAGVAAAPVLTLHESQPAPQGQEFIVQSDTATASPSGAVTNTPDPIAVERGRVMEINALCLEHGVDATLASSMIGRGVTVDAAAKEILQAKRTERATAPRISGGNDRAGDRSFDTLGEQLMAVVKAGKGAVDPRLQRMAAVSGMNESVGSEGGFLISPEFLPGLTKVVFEDDPILSRVKRIPSSKNVVKYNVLDETSRATGSRQGGVQVYWAAEADTATAKKPKLRQMVLEKKKVMGLAYLTDELNDDAPAAQAIVSDAFSSELAFTIANAVFRGTGAGQPLGFLNSGALASVAIEAAQTIANTAQSIAINTSKMLSRVPASLWNDVIFLYNQELLPKLAVATIGTSGAVPVFMGSGGMSGKPYDTIWGRPAFASELCEAEGTAGDIICIAPRQYAVLGGDDAKFTESIHVRFLYDENCLKFTTRVDGAPEWTSTITRFKGGSALSPFVTLAVRA